jgi:hypothetical protein
MAKITGWDKFRNSLGFGYSNKTVEAIKLETEIFIENLRKQAAERVAKLEKTKPAVVEGINKKAAENKKAAAKKPVAKATAKKEAIKKDIAETPVAKKTPATKKPAPKKSGK